MTEATPAGETPRPDERQASEAEPEDRRLTARLRRRPALLASARARILIAFSVLLALSTVASLVLVRGILHARLDEEIDRQMTQEIGEFRRLVGGNDPSTGRPFGPDLRSIFDVYFSRNVPDEGEVILSYVGGRRYKAARAGEAPYPVGEFFKALASAARSGAARRGNVETSVGHARYVLVPVKIGGEVRGAFVAANFPGNEEGEVNDAVKVAGAVAAAVFLIALAVAWVAAGRVLAPLRLLRDTARSITESDLTRRIPAGGRDEVAQLATTFNEMLDRLETAFATQRRFLDDAGHELRTPITIVRGHLELLEEDKEARASTIALVMDELDRMSRMVNDLLLLAKSEEPDFLELEPVDVGELTDDLQTKASALAPREWTVESRGSGLVAADRQRLTQAVIQLADNAVKHTADGDPIALGSAFANGEVRFWVRDGGPGVPLEEQSRIFDRFSQGASARGHDGVGLGLSIVRAIAEAHGGQVELYSRPGAGATFTVVLPGQQPRATAGAR